MRSGSISRTRGRTTRGMVTPRYVNRCDPSRALSAAFRGSVAVGDCDVLGGKADLGNGALIRRVGRHVVDAAVGIALDRETLRAGTHPLHAYESVALFDDRCIGAGLTLD